MPLGWLLCAERGSGALSWGRALKTLWIWEAITHKGPSPEAGCAVHWDCCLLGLQFLWCGGPGCALSCSKLPKAGELRLSWAHPWSLFYQDTSASTLPCLTVLEECLRSITFCCEVFLELSPHLSHNIMSSSLSWSLVKIKSFRLCKGCCVGSA